MEGEAGADVSVLRGGVEGGCGDAHGFHGGGVGYLDTYTPPMPVDVKEVWLNGQLAGVAMRGMLLFDIGDKVAGRAGVHHLTLGDERVVRYKGRLYWESHWLQETFPGAADAIREWAWRCCDVIGWKRQESRGTTVARDMSAELTRRLVFAESVGEFVTSERARASRASTPVPIGSRRGRSVTEDW